MVLGVVRSVCVGLHSCMDEAWGTRIGVPREGGPSGNRRDPAERSRLRTVMPGGLPTGPPGGAGSTAAAAGDVPGPTLSTPAKGRGAAPSTRPSPPPRGPAPSPAGPTLDLGCRPSPAAGPERPDPLRSPPPRPAMPFPSGAPGPRRGAVGPTSPARGSDATPTSASSACMSRSTCC